MKTFYLKILTTVLILVGLYTTITYYLEYTQSKNFQIINERQSVIIQLPNTEYIEIASKNDHVSDSDEFFRKPFGVNTKIQKNSNLENSIAGINSHIEYVENGKGISRYIILKPKGVNTISIEVLAETAYTFEEDLKYNIQLDYSNKTEYKEDNGYAYFEDKGCRVEVHDPMLDYEVSENEQSIILSKPYDLVVEYDLDIIISCKE